MLRLLRQSLLVQCSSAVLALSVAPNLLLAHEDDPGLQDRFLAGMANAEKRCRQAPCPVRIKATTTRQLSPKTIEADYSPEVLAKLRKENAGLAKPTVIAAAEYASRSDLHLEMGARDGVEFVMARNRHYAFHIKRGPELKKYSLQFLERVGVDPAVDTLIDEKATRSIVTTRSLAWSMFGKRLWEWVDSPDFKIKAASEIQSGGETFVRIDFEHLVDAVRPGRLCLSSAYLICDPAADWALREFEASFVNPVKGVAVTRQRGSLDYGEPDERLSFPIPKTVSLSTTWIDDVKSIDRTVAQLEVISTDVPEEVFYLSHYGLPEPNFNQGWFGAWVWYLVAGVVCLGVGRMVLRRRRAAG